MTSPTSITSNPLTNPGLTPQRLWHATFRSMASPIRVQLGFDTPDPDRCHAEVRALFTEVARQCTRFEPDSDLMLANAAGTAWQAVGAYCLAALEAAAQAHAMTGGMFDPRVLQTLSDLGYARTRPFAGRDVTVEFPTQAPRLHRAPWSLGLDRRAQSVCVGAEPIDLGGIGKGLALRWVADQLVSTGCDTFLIDAGGDCVSRGAGPDGDGWRIGVEDPSGGPDPVAVLSVIDRACATSSTRLLAWQAGGRSVHHLIDPRTGRPGGGGLRAVTVVGDDPALAEVWSKTLFLHGDAIGEVAQRHAIAALWVHSDGSYEMSDAIRQHVIWECR